METERTYDDGLRDGKIEALEQITAIQSARLDDHGKRLAIIERIIWALAGIIAFIEVWPKIAVMLGG